MSFAATLLVHLRRHSQERMHDVVAQQVLDRDRSADSVTPAQAMFAAATPLAAGWIAQHVCIQPELVHRRIAPRHPLLPFASQFGGFSDIASRVLLTDALVSQGVDSMFAASALASLIRTDPSGVVTTQLYNVGSSQQSLPNQALIALTRGGHVPRTAQQRELVRAALNSTLHVTYPEAWIAARALLLRAGDRDSIHETAKSLAWFADPSSSKHAGHTQSIHGANEALRWLFGLQLAKENTHADIECQLVKSLKTMPDDTHRHGLLLSIIERNPSAAFIEPLKSLHERNASAPLRKRIVSTLAAQPDPDFPTWFARQTRHDTDAILEMPTPVIAAAVNHPEVARIVAGELTSSNTSRRHSAIEASLWALQHAPTRSSTTSWTPLHDAVATCESRIHPASAAAAVIASLNLPRIDARISSFATDNSHSETDRCAAVAALACSETQIAREALCDTALHAPSGTPLRRTALREMPPHIARQFVDVHHAALSVAAVDPHLSDAYQALDSVTRGEMVAIARALGTPNASPGHFRALN